MVASFVPGWYPGQGIPIQSLPGANQPPLTAIAIMMDAILSAMMLADAQAMCAEAGQTVTIGGADFPAMVSDPTLAPTLEAGGLMERISTLVKLPTTPAVLAIKASCQPGKKLTFDGRVYRITAFTTKPGSAWYQLQCQDADQH
jgi:hypothetical protein